MSVKPKTEIEMKNCITEGGNILVHGDDQNVIFKYPIKFNFLF